VRSVRALAALSAIAVLVGCGGSSDDDSGGNNAATSGDSPLTRAAPFAGEGAAAVEFVDWAAVRKTVGAEATTGTGLARVADIGPLSTRTPPGVAGELGFDLGDLEWEARVEGATPLTLVGFPGDFDFATVERRMERCGYERSEIEGGVLYSRERLQSCEGDDTSPGILEPRLSNVAVLADDAMLVAASSPEAVERAVESRGESDAFESTLDDLGSTVDDVVAGYVGTGEFGCRMFGVDAGVPGRLTPEIAEELERRQGDLGEPYEALLVGFVPEGDRFDGRIALDYEDGGQAEDGLDARRKSFEEVTSPVTREPLSADMRLGSAEVEDDAIVFSVAPREGPLQLFGRVIKRDLPFAGC
jgi:hypothetical protein